MRRGLLLTAEQCYSLSFSINSSSVMWQRSYPSVIWSDVQGRIMYASTVGGEEALDAQAMELHASRTIHVVAFFAVAASVILDVTILATSDSESSSSNEVLSPLSSFSRRYKTSWRSSTFPNEEVKIDAPQPSAPATEDGREHNDSLPSPRPSPSPRQAEKKQSSQAAPLDPVELTALRLLGLSVEGINPCATSPTLHRSVDCDGGSPYQHIVSLRLEYCRDGATLSPSAWSSLSSLRTLSFEECPAPPFKVPPSLARSVESLTIMASLGMSVSNVLSDPLHGTWIAEFYNLHQLSVSDVQVNLSNLRVIISSMKHAEQIIFSDTSLRGEIPSKWPSRNITVLHLSHNELQGGIPSSLLSLTKLESMDLSFNNLEGRLPENLDALQNLQYLSLASNQLTGGIPSFIQNLRSLVYIDLSNNLFHGPIPSFFNDMTNLRYIDMRGNYLEGVVPFTESFLQGLNTCKLGANMDLCYNASVIYSIEFMEGVTPCKREKPRDRTSAPSPSPSSSEEDPFRNLPVPQGPSKAIIIIALALSCTVAAILMTICLSRKCAQKDP